jgi:uncharacterized protein (UPF0335 family)
MQDCRDGFDDRICRRFIDVRSRDIAKSEERKPSDNG